MSELAQALTRRGVIRQQVTKSHNKQNTYHTLSSVQRTLEKSRLERFEL